MLILLAAVIICYLNGLTPVKIIKWLFSAQYNENGISHFLIITIDEKRPRRFVGRLDDHNIYAEKLNNDETCFRSIGAKNVSMKDVFDNGVVSIEDWRKYAGRIRLDGDIDILQYDRYEIAIKDVSKSTRRRLLFCSHMAARLGQINDHIPAYNSATTRQGRPVISAKFMG